MKKVFVLCCLLGIGIFGGAKVSNAAAYVGNMDNINIDPESNKEAIRRLTESGEINEIDIPLENLTVETNLEGVGNFNMLRASLKPYYYAQISVQYGISQAKVPELVPTGFNWKDNGIPGSCMYNRSGGQPTGAFQFYTNTVTDSGIGGYNYGYYWRKFNTKQGSFWASAWNLNHLFYG